MWFGTQNGLARFDGYDIRIFRNEPDNPNSISHNNIWCLLEGKSGCIWIGTRNGDLNRYDTEKDLFEKYNICNSNDEENYISCLYEHSDGSLWIGTYNKGLYNFNQKDKSIQHWNHIPGDSSSLSNDFINGIVPDSDGNLWVGTYSGLNRFSLSGNNKYFKKYFTEDGLSNNLIWRIVRSENPHVLYIGTYNGLTVMNLKTHTFEVMPVHDPNQQLSNSIGSIIEYSAKNGLELWLGSYGGLTNYNLLSKQKRHWHQNSTKEALISEQINDLWKDRSGVLWIATENGISRLPEKRFRFTNEDLNTLSSKDRHLIDEADISSIVKVKNGNLYLGTTKGLICIINTVRKSEVVSLPQFKGKYIWSLHECSSENLLIGTYGDGLYKYNMISYEVNNIEFASPNERSTPYKYVKTVVEDSKGRIWAGFWGGGLAVINNENKNQKIFRKDMTPQSISFNDVWKIYEDRFGRIWVGTNGGGLNLYSEKNGGTFVKLDGIKNSILSIYEQKNKSVSENTILWLGTRDGLVKLEIQNANTHNDTGIIFSLKNYSSKEGLSNSIVSGIVEDSRGYLWLTTNSGLIRFSPDNEQFVNFSVHDGLTCNNFEEGGVIFSNGNIYAGGRGLNIINPEIRLSDFQPQVVFTDLWIGNNQIRVTSDSPLSKEIAYTNKIDLNYDQNTFTLSFSAFDFNFPDLINYSYKLEGFDQEWKFSGSHKAAYTNIDPGDYILKVKASNSDNIWENTPSQLLIRINPPWWKSYWAYTIYIFLIILGFIELRKFQAGRTKLWQELRMHELEARKHLELENLKSRFFANLSHEFRTPLMLIKGPVEQLLSTCKDSEDAENFNQLNIISRNSKKLQELIDQLLELTQLEAASIPLRAKKVSLIILLRGIVSSFESMAAQKSITLVFNSPDNELSLWIDQDKFEKIITNLLSNALKFTDKSGIVSVSIEVIKSLQLVEIKIADTGIGIPVEHLPNIFNRFYQVNDSIKRAFGGTGIGLALVKELVDLHKLKITVQSEPDKGTVFTLSIPLDESYLDEEHKIYSTLQDADLTQTLISSEKFKDDNRIENKTANGAEENNGHKKVILLIDDSSDVRKYLHSILHTYYFLLQAESGEDGLRIVSEHTPDLIICDVMMPFMDGIEFCRQVKSNWETSHIPVILLTARASVENRIEGLETGADVYLTKPFASKELLTQINNLIDQRKRLKEKFSREIKISPSSVAPSLLDNEFLEKAFRVVEENLSRMDFDTEAFANQMFVSRSQLHRKILAITGLAPGEFLRSFRLKKAAEMLTENRFSIIRISLEVGFSSPSHFAKAFHKQFKCLPSEFKA
jgi:signal transduction histidine kinase/ligand-binding sensor domain-containing protein/DNA-binding response OmpR family regulator